MVRVFVYIIMHNWDRIYEDYVIKVIIHKMVLVRALSWLGKLFLFAPFLWVLLAHSNNTCAFSFTCFTVLHIIWNINMEATHCVILIGFVDLRVCAQRERTSGFYGRCSLIIDLAPIVRSRNQSILNNAQMSLSLLLCIIDWCKEVLYNTVIH